MRWLGAVEGYYGPPLEHRARLELVRWMGGQGFNSYGYAPKDDPYHRAHWRDPYPADRMGEFAELLEVGRDAGVAVALILSPGLDWRDGDERALATKLVTFRDLGARALGVAWDDVPPGGVKLGRRHGGGVAAAVEAVGSGVDWITCPTDYSGLHVTPYLRAYADALPGGVEILWTVPGIVSPYVDAGDVRRFTEELGRPIVFAENFPVNDGAMAGVLHLGPYPRRDPALPRLTNGVVCNFMSRPLASRIGLAVAAEWWRRPDGDREQQWADVIAVTPGIEPLARASRSWVGDDGPDAHLAALVDGTIAGAAAATDELRAYLFAGCRNGLDGPWLAELEPWLDQWDHETQAMQYALHVLAARPDRPAPLAFILSELWSRARASRQQLFGVRWAMYPVTERRSPDRDLDVRPEAVVSGENLTDRLCRAALTS